MAPKGEKKPAEKKPAAVKSVKPAKKGGKKKGERLLAVKYAIVVHNCGLPVLMLTHFPWVLSSVTIVTTLFVGNPGG
jgi:hypothetical protein